MDAIGTFKPVIQVLAKPQSQSVPVLPKAPEVSVPSHPVPDVASYEQKRLETVHRLSQGIANVHVLGDQTFTIFKDATGQYITRFRSQRNGEVVYIPEPTLFKIGGSDAPAALAFKV